VVSIEFLSDIFTHQRGAAPQDSLVGTASSKAVQNDVTIGDLLQHAVKLRLSGCFKESIDVYEYCFSACRASADPAGVLEALLGLGHANRECGQSELAIEYYELTERVGQLLRNSSMRSRALNGLGIVYQLCGEIDQAESYYTSANSHAKSSGDLRGVANTELNLGTVRSIRGDLRGASCHYESALRNFEASHDQRGMVRTLNNLGMLYVDNGQVNAAQYYLDRALHISRSIGDLASECAVHANRAELFIAKNDPNRARISCDLAFSLADHLGDYRAKAEALKFYGIIYRELHMIHLAEIHLRRAIEFALKYNSALTEAESQRELALVYRKQNKNREALRALNRSYELFMALRAERDQIDVAKRVADLEHDFLSLVQMWGESLEARDRYTRGHCQRVAEYACRLALRVGFPESDIVWFRMGAFLHDVGKTEIPEEILSKNAALTHDERHIMERHPLIGDAILAPLAFPWDIRPMVRSHHERWDGRGYPDGLKGKDIPKTARILRLADIFDALTTARSYRQPLTASEALLTMQNDEGSFDPELFFEFKQMLLECN
jgi:putative nucleotidyltransferase with HDIG domain